MRNRLSSTKFKSADHLALIMDFFEDKIKWRFNHSDDVFSVRLAESGNDSSAGIREGVLLISG